MITSDTKRYALFRDALLQMIEYSKAEEAADIAFDDVHITSQFFTEHFFDAQCRKVGIEHTTAHGADLYPANTIFGPGYKPVEGSTPIPAEMIRYGMGHHD